MGQLSPIQLNTVEIPGLSVGESLNNDLTAEFDNKIHLRVKKRTGRKFITTVENLPNDLNFKKFLKMLKRDLSCNGSVGADNDKRKTLILQGDHREELRKILIDELDIKDKNIIIHGF